MITLIIVLFCIYVVYYLMMQLTSDTETSYIFKPKEKKAENDLIEITLIVAGVTYYTGKNNKPLVYEYEKVSFIHEPDNPVDPKAIKIVNSKGEQIGHVPADSIDKLNEIFLNYEVEAFVSSIIWPKKGYKNIVLKGFGKKKVAPISGDN